jgi:hypothetical protein
MSEKKEIVTTTFRLPKELYNLLYNEIKWAEKKPVNTIIIEALNSWLTKQGYK